MNKVFKNSVFRRREIENLTAPANGLLHSIQFQIRNRQHWRRDALSAADESFDSGEKFSQVKWFAEIIVGPSIQQIDDRFFAFLGSENKDRRMKSSSPQILEHTLTALAGKHQVEDDCIVETLFGEQRTGFAVGGM